MTKPLPTVSPATWKQRYEDLRGHVLDGSRSLGAAPLSFVLLCRQGLAGWMRGWHELSVTQSPRLPFAPTEALLPVTPLWQQQLTGLLAQMTTQLLTVL